MSLFSGTNLSSCKDTNNVNPNADAVVCLFSKLKCIDCFFWGNLELAFLNVD